MFGPRKTQTSQGVPPAGSASANNNTSQQQAMSQTTPRQPVGFETVLGINSMLKGEFKSKANVRLDGTFEGSLHIEGNVLIGENARIIADINAKNIQIAGAVRGNINGNKVQLLRTGRIWGDITANAITTEEGAFIDGKITMLGHPAGLAGFEPAGSLPAPEGSVLQPIAEDALSGEPVRAELVDDPRGENNNNKNDDTTE